MRPTLRTYAILSAASLCAGCQNGATEARWSTTDSAGISIVLSEPAGASRGELVDPILSLGTVDGGGPFDFFQIRDVEIIGGDRIAVANAGSEEVRIFDLEGRHLGSFGRAGRGPREFLRLQMVEDMGDSLLIYEAGNDRVSVRAMDGTFGRSFHLEWFHGLLFPVHLSAEHGILAVTARHMTELAGTGIVVDTSLVSRYDLEGQLLDSLARLPHNQRFVRQVGDLRTTVGAPFTVGASLVTTDSGFCHAFGSAPEIRCHDRLGELTEIWRVSTPARPVTDADIARFWRELEAGKDGVPAVMERLRGDLVYPEFFPAISGLVTDDLGRVWARRYPGEDPSTRSWWLFDEGRLVAEFDAPPGFEIMDVEDGLVVGVWRDDFDIEYVRVFRQTLRSDGE